MTPDLTLPPLHRFYQAQLDALRMSGGQFIWAPRGFGVHRVLDEWSQVAEPSDPRIKLQALYPRDRLVAPNATDHTYLILLQIEADFGAILEGRAPGVFLEAMQKRQTLVTSSLPRYLVDAVHLRRLLPVDDPQLWCDRWSNWWDMYGWEATELQSWSHGNRRLMEVWCAAAEEKLLAGGGQGGRRLWPDSLGVQPRIIRAAWDSVLREERGDWQPEELETAVLHAAMSCEPMRALFKTVDVLVQAPGDGRAVDLLRRLAGLEALPEVAEADLALQIEADQLHQLGLTYQDTTGAGPTTLQLTCPLLAAALRVRLDASVPQGRALPAKSSKASRTSVSWRFDQVRYEGDEHEGTLALLGPGVTARVPVSGPKHVLFVKHLIDAGEPVTVEALQALLGAEKPKHVINHVERLRMSLDEQRRGLRGLVRRKRGAISLVLQSPTR